MSQGIHRAPFATFTDAPYPKTGKARSYFQLCHTPANIVRGTTLIRVLFSTVSLCRNMSKIVLWATTVSWRGLAERPSFVPNWCRGADWLNAHPFPTWVENIGFEPMASCVRCKRSSQAELIPRSAIRLPNWEPPPYGNEDRSTGPLSRQEVRTI